MAVNKGVAVGALGIVALSSITATMQHKGITRIAVGGYVVAIIGSVIDLIPGAQGLAGSLVMTAFVGVLLTELGNFLGLFQGVLGNQPPSGGAPVGPGRK